MHVEPQLKAKLEPFKTIEDFKVLYTVSAKKLKAYLDRSWNQTMIRIHIMNKMLYCAGATDFRKPITKKFSVLRHHWKIKNNFASLGEQKNVVELLFVNLVYKNPPKNRENHEWTRSKLFNGMNTQNDYFLGKSIKSINFTKFFWIF